MKKAFRVAGVIALGLFVMLGYMIYKVGEDMANMHRCGCHERNY